MNYILAFTQSASGKICLNLLTADNQLESWFHPLIYPVAIVFFIFCWRLLNRAKSHTQVSAGTVIGLIILCVVLVTVGWGMSQFFDPTC